jgi:hypothetical protein
MLKKFTIIGNCQADALSKFLLSNQTFKNTYEYIDYIPIFKMTPEELDKLYIDVLPFLDLIIIQPISENYNNNYKYSTKSILNTVKKDCIKILFPSLYFDYYHPFNIYITDKNNIGWKLGDPYDYHDKNILKSFVNSLTEDEAINKYYETIYNPDLLTEHYFNERLLKNINNLKERELKYIDYCTEDTHIINSSSFIMEYYNKILLFYTINHPTKYLFYYIANYCFIYLNIPLETYPEEIDPLKALIMPVYMCLQKCLKFDISYYFNFRHFEIILDDKETIKKYYNGYKNTSRDILDNNLL